MLNSYYAITSMINNKTQYFKCIEEERVRVNKDKVIYEIGDKVDVKLHVLGEVVGIYKEKNEYILRLLPNKYYKAPPKDLSAPVYIIYKYYNL